MVVVSCRLIRSVRSVIVFASTPRQQLFQRVCCVEFDNGGLELVSSLNGHKCTASQILTVRPVFS